MEHDEFMYEMLRPTFVWNMATGNRDCLYRGMQKSNATRSSNAQAKIDALVKERARTLGMRDDFGTQ